MRTRKDIENQVLGKGEYGHYDSAGASYRQDAIIELLLDIRDLLQQGNKNKPE